MKSVTSTQVGLLIVLAAIIGGVYYFYFAQRQESQTQVQEQSREVFNIVGEVKSVGDKSFVVSQEGKDYTVNVGADTQMIKLTLPPISDDSGETTFTPEKRVITILDITTQDQVFVRSSHSVKPGEDIVNPLEVQVLP
ncbi:MAG: hypothetical protein Q8P03_02235 [bacterium]|nr:hypothetical protein [bacterium]